MFGGVCNPYVILTNKCTCAPTWDLWLGVVRVYGDWEMGCPNRGWELGRNGGMMECLSCSVSMSCSMLSQTCRRWYFPRFLFNVGSLTLINIASLMVLDELWVSLCIMLKQSGFKGCPVVLL